MATENIGGEFLKGLGGRALGGTLGVGLRVAGGQGVGRAILGEIGDALLYQMFPGVGAAKMISDTVPALAQIGKQVHDTKKAQWQGTFEHNMAGRPFIDTEATATMRQRAVMAIQKSKMNARSVLGREASLMHQGMATPPYMRIDRMGW
jgi:hypothetical protein